MLVDTQLRLRSVVLANDVRIEYAESGLSTGLPVVCLYGVTDSWRSFEGVMRWLPESLRVLAISQRGHGNSSRPQSGYAPADFSADVVAFLDALAIRKAVIVGHSMGSIVAQRFAIDHPDRTLGLVLMGSTPTMRDNAAVQELWKVVSTMTDPVDAGFVREFQESTLSRPIAERELDLFVRESLKVPARVWRDALAALMEFDHRQALASVTAPTLLCWGDAETVFLRADFDALRAAMPDARTKVYEGNGHAFHWEDPTTFAADLAAFCLSPLGQP